MLHVQTEISFKTLRMRCAFFIRVSKKKKIVTGRFSTAERRKNGKERNSREKNWSTLASSFDNKQQRVAIYLFSNDVRARTVNITCTYDTQCSIIRLAESIERQVKRAECSPTSFSLNGLIVVPQLFMQEEKARKEDTKSTQMTVPMINYRQLVT